jgi:hypothetical protein
MQAAATIDQQRWIKIKASQLTGVMPGAISLAKFGQRL